jgi:hypothetical protein
MNRAAVRFSRPRPAASKPEAPHENLMGWCGAVIRDQGGTVRLDSHGISQGYAAKAEAEINPTEAVQSDGEDREEIEPMT